MSDYKQLLEELPCPCCGLKKTELARLKELNLEMVEVIKLHCDQCKIEQMITEDVCSVIECSFYKVLKKARGEGE